MTYAELLQLYISDGQRPLPLPNAAPVCHLLSLLHRADPKLDIGKLLMDFLVREIETRLASVPGSNWALVHNIGTGPGRPTKTLHIAGLNALPSYVMPLLESAWRIEKEGRAITNPSTARLCAYYAAHINAKRMLREHMEKTL